MKLEERILRRLLDAWPIGHLATVTPGGDPHVLPVVFAAVDGRVYSPVDAKRKSGKTLARVRNVESGGCASLLLDGYSDDWSRLWWVRLDGPAWIESADAAVLEVVADRLRRKYPQYAELAPYSARPTLLVLEWERRVAWSQQGSDGPIRAAAGMGDGGRSRG